MGYPPPRNLRKIGILTTTMNMPQPPQCRSHNILEPFHKPQQCWGKLPLEDCITFLEAHAANHLGRIMFLAGVTSACDRWMTLARPHGIPLASAGAQYCVQDEGRRTLILSSHRLKQEVIKSSSWLAVFCMAVSKRETRLHKTQGDV